MKKIIFIGIVLMVMVFSPLTESIAQLHPAPPPAKVEKRPPPPSENAVWIDGHWKHRDGEWVWISGHWQRGPGPKAK